MLGRHWAELTTYLVIWHGEQFEFHGQALPSPGDLVDRVGTAIKGTRSSSPATIWGHREKSPSYLWSGRQPSPEPDWAVLWPNTWHFLDGGKACLWCGSKRAVVACMGSVPHEGLVCPKFSPPASRSDHLRGDWNFQSLTYQGSIHWWNCNRKGLEKWGKLCEVAPHCRRGHWDMPFLKV